MKPEWFAIFFGGISAGVSVAYFVVRQLIKSAVLDLRLGMTTEFGRVNVRLTKIEAKEFKCKAADYLEVKHGTGGS